MPGRERREGVEGYQPAGGILPPAARAKRRSVTRHPVVDLHHRAAQRPEPAEHGGDALEVKRRGKAVYRALAGVGSHGCQFFSQEAPVGGKGLDGVRPGAEPREVGARRVQVSLENVAVSAAGYGPGSFGRHRLERNWLAGPVKSAQVVQGHTVWRQGQRKPPSDTPLRNQRMASRKTIMVGTVAITEAAKNGPHATVWVPINSASPTGSV